MNREKMAARLAGMPTDDIIVWADNAASGMQRYMDDFRRTLDEACLAEIKLAALTMDAVTDELALRLKQYQEQLAREQHQE